jgi:cysteine/serine-rich nuclear protein
MTSQHVFSKKFSLQDYASEQKRLHKTLLLRLKQQNNHESNEVTQSSDEEEESEESQELNETELDAELDGYYFLQPVSTKQRRLLLREAGVKKIDSEEKKQNSGLLF